MTRSTSRISLYETRYNDEIDFYVRSPKNRMRGDVVTITTSNVLLDFGTKKLISLSIENYIKILTAEFILRHTSYVLTTVPKTFSNELKTKLRNYLIKKVRIGEFININVSSIDSIENLAFINVKDNVTYIKKTQLFNELYKVKKSDQVISGFILRKIKGGFSVAIGGIVAFLPNKKMLNIPHKKIAHKFIDMSLYFKISKLTFESTNIVLRKAYG